MIHKFKKLKADHKKAVNLLKRNHTGMYAFVGGVGVIMFWYGLWESLPQVPYIGQPVVSMIVGLVIMLFFRLMVFELIGDSDALIVDDEQVDYPNYSEEREKMAKVYALEDQQVADEYFS